MNTPDPGRAERELEELLRRVAPERPDPARRAEARKAFLAAGRAGAEDPSRAPAAARMGGVMAHGAGTEEHEEQDGFVAWLAARAPAAPPSADVRRRARLAFLTAVASQGPPLRTRRSFRRLVWAVAAAAILAVTFLLPEPERWSVELDGRLTCDGAEYLPGDGVRLAAALERTGTVETARAGARFELGRELALQLLADTALVFPFVPDLDGVAPLEFELTRGEAYLSTSDSYPGNPILVRTALASVALHGTTVGVLVDEQGTCVCVAEGTARVTSTCLPAGFQDVGPRTTLRMFHDPGMGPKVEPFGAEDGGPETAHTAELAAFQHGR